MSVFVSVGNGSVIVTLATQDNCYKPPLIIFSHTQHAAGESLSLDWIPGKRERKGTGKIVNERMK